MMSWALKHPFVVSAVFHGGSEVVSYPMDDAAISYELGDAAYSDTPDDKIFISLAKVYANAHRFMAKDPLPECSPKRTFAGKL